MPASTSTSRSQESLNNVDDELPSLRFKIPAQAEESLRVKLRKFADKRCGPSLAAFAACSKNKTFTVVTACREEHTNFVECVNKYVNEPNLNRLRHAYVRGEMMKEQSYDDWKEELNKRKKDIEKENENE